MKQPYVVEITSTKVERFVVPDCNSVEEAESIAEDMFSQGEEGETVELNIDSTDAYPEG